MPFKILIASMECRINDITTMIIASMIIALMECCGNIGLQYNRYNSHCFATNERNPCS